MVTLFRSNDKLNGRKSVCDMFEIIWFYIIEYHVILSCYHRRSEKTVALKMLGTLADQVGSESYALSSLFESTVGKVKGTSTTFLIDIDYLEPTGDEKIDEENRLNTLDDVQKIIVLLQDWYNKRYWEHYAKMVKTKLLWTPNGYHILTSSFDTRILKENGYDYDIHKNNPTILYYSNNKLYG